MNERKHLEHAVAALGDEHAVTPRDVHHENTSYTDRDLELEHRRQAAAQGKHGLAFGGAR